MAEIPTQTDRESASSSHTNTDEKRRNRPSRRFVFWAVVAVAVIVGIVFGIPYYLHTISHESTDDAFIEGHVIPISPRVAGHVAKVYLKDNQWVNTDDLLFELDPRDFKANFDAAQAVLKAAESLRESCRINVNLTTIKSTSSLDEAKANEAAARAVVEAAKAQAMASDSQIVEAQAQLASTLAILEQTKAEVSAARAQYQRDYEDLKRYQEMAQTNVVTGQQLDHAVASELMSKARLESAKGKVHSQQAHVQQAEATLKAAEDNLKQAQALVVVRSAALEESKARLKAARSAPQQVAYINSQVAQAEADIARAQAELEQAKLRLSYAKVYAPCDGYVTKKSVKSGAFVHVGQPLLAIVPPDVWIVANFKETQLTRMHPGQPVKIEVDTYPGVTFKAHVDSIQRGTGARFSLLPPENATGNYIKVVQRVPVKIIFDDLKQLDKYLLAPGMSVVLEVEISAQGRSATSNVAVTTNTTFLVDPNTPLPNRSDSP